MFKIKVHLLRYTCLSLIIAALPQFCLAAGSPCDPWAAKAVSVQGTMEVRSAGGAQWAPVKLNDTFCPGDEVRVLDNSRASLALANESVLRLNANSAMVIQGFKDEDRGRLMFRKALRIYKRVQLDRQVATPRLLRIFNSVKRNAGVRVIEAPRPRPGPRPPEPEPEDEKPAKGLEHTPLEEAPRNTALVVKCRVAE